MVLVVAAVVIFLFGRGGLYCFTENEFAGAFLILCLLLVLCIILYCFSIAPVMRYEASLKEKIYPIIIKFFGPFDYKERIHNIIKNYSNFRITLEYSSESSRNWISGSYAGVEFEAFGTTLSKEGSDNRFSQTGFDSPLSKATFDVLRAKRDLAALRLPSKRVLATRFSRSASRIEEKTVFHGLVVRMAVHKNFRGRTIIRHDAGVVGNFGRALLQGLQRVNLEDPVFEQAFEVAASNQVEARYLLTPSFMERLLELSRSFGGAALQGSFHQGSLFLMIPHRSLLFRPASITEYEDFIDDSQAVLKAMNKIFSVIETLKMDMDIKL